MENEIKLKINGKEVLAKKGVTILEAARENGIDIPSLCFHPDLSVKSNCRLCLVEIKGEKGLKTSCSTKIKGGTEIISESPEISRARKINLELIFSQHLEECADCVWLKNCQLLKFARQYKVETKRFADRKSKRPIFQFGPIVFDETKCIDCRNCIEACPVNFLELKGRGADIEVAPSKDPKKECISCGQCIIHCPVGAIESAGEFESIEEPLRDKNKFTVVQFAPAIRSTIGEEFGMPYGEIITGKLVAGLKKLGFKKVFDTSVGADFTTIEEAKELAGRIATQKNLPAFSSCCPSWVKFLEFYHPELLKNLCTTRSPQVILGGLIKTYWAEKEKINPNDIVVVSIMPCVSKKYEIMRSELKINGIKPVDTVMTTRELARLFRNHKIDLKNINPKPADPPFDLPSGAGIIYGASGGVFESAFRTAYKDITGKELADLEIKELRGDKGTKIRELSIDGKKIRSIAVSGLKNAETMLGKLKADPKAFDAMEVMACPGGCIGGGGQPLPVDNSIRKKRADTLYGIDASKDLRVAHKNPIVKQVYDEFLNDNALKHSICHTEYSQKARTQIKKLKNSLETNV